MILPIAATVFVACVLTTFVMEVIFDGPTHWWPRRTELAHGCIVILGAVAAVVSVFSAIWKFLV
jgi:hypothetical protein